MLTVSAFSISLDGYGAGPEQSREHPLGVGGQGLHEWLVATQTFRKMTSQDGGTTGMDDAFAVRSFENVGAWILGRNMFGPVRGPWPDQNWKGWWGENPPYHVPVFVLTHYAREPIVMQGGTTFHFVTAGIEAAVEQAAAAAGEHDVRVGGGVATIRQFLEARRLDRIHLAVSPVLLGAGEALFAGLNLVKLGYACTDMTAGEKAMHVVLHRLSR